MSIRSLALALALAAGGLAGPAAGQEGAGAVPADVERMVREGLTEALESRLAGGRTPEELHLLAQAYANRARQARESEDRQRAFEQAAAKHAKRVEALERKAAGGALADVVRLAAARVEYAGMILSGQAAAELDEFEITAGQRGDRARLAAWLATARGQYERAAAALAPLLEDLRAYEEDLLAAGLYDTVVQARLDATLNLGWALYYLARLESGDDAARRHLLATAERRFQDLIDSGQSGQMRYVCHLALAMAQREQGRIDEAERNFRFALGEDVDRTVEAQARYELARAQIAAGKYDEARTTLRPLVEKDPRSLAPDDRPARFYINLAHIWDAYSHLLEAEAVRHQARDSTARTAILQKAQRSRELGLTKMKRLAQFGGPWPALVQLYVAASVDLKTPPAELSPIELLYTAGTLMDARRHEEALARLQEAAGRPDLDDALAGDVLFELGRCQYQLENVRAAAEAFQRLAAEHRSHPKAPQAATFAYQLWGKLAERSRRPEDYLQLAATLRNLVESFADHPGRRDALWLLPVALQLAGRHAEAAEHFAKVPAESPNWEEAQFRRALCGRQACEAARATLAPPQYAARAQEAAAGLLRYADEARDRAATAPNAAAVLEWAAQARVAAAELLAGPGVEQHRAALAALDGFEARHPDSGLLGRVLAVRIRAYRGLREFEQASAILARFLQEAPPAQVGATLAGLAKGMQEEVERLQADGQGEAARQLAADSVETFAELEKWVRADPGRAQNLDYVLYGRAQMHYFAGQYDEALQRVADLLARSPRNGNYQHLQALVLSARLAVDAPAAELERAREAWGALLTDPGIRARAPERYWEARCAWLALALRLGQAADVEAAITQERVWYPDLGGAPWKERLEALLAEARAAQGKPADSQPRPAGPAADPPAAGGDAGSGSAAGGAP